VSALDHKYVEFRDRALKAEAKVMELTGEVHRLKEALREIKERGDELERWDQRPGRKQHISDGTWFATRAGAALGD
jgi:hypothetical protein